MTNTYAALIGIAEAMPVIDTHEHLPLKAHFQGKKPDILADYLSHYISSDLRAAGMTLEDYDRARDAGIDLMERWTLLEPWLDQVRNTSYYKSLQIAMRKIHGIDDMTGDTIRALNESFVKSVSDPEYKRRIMKDMCHIEKSIDCVGDDPEFLDDLATPAPDEFFARTFYPEAFAMPWVTVEQKNLDDYCEAYRARYELFKGAGAVALKIAMAYDRTLHIAEVGYDEAAALFAAYDNNSGRFPQPLQDYMLRYALTLADEDGFPVQIHTGIQEGMFNDIENSNPMLLKNIFRQYPNVPFDLFHIGYPYQSELITLAKYHPNVHIDMCWANIISPFASRNFFREALDVIPYTKIFAFGGDYLFFDGVVGHLQLAKQNICEVLAEKVDRGEYNMALAEKILRAVFYGNAKRVFGL
ncbi:MAG: amidohydrolase family protein [Oscillospiraceae bacterium]|nr:amidohydrolase family protein [Oscillospiraceae bacterium]